MRVLITVFLAFAVTRGSAGALEEAPSKEPSASDTAIVPIVDPLLGYTLPSFFAPLALLSSLLRPNDEVIDGDQMFGGFLAPRMGGVPDFFGQASVTPKISMNASECLMTVDLSLLPSTSDLKITTTGSTVTIRYRARETHDDGLLGGSVIAQSRSMTQLQLPDECTQNPEGAKATIDEKQDALIIKFPLGKSASVDAPSRDGGPPAAGEGAPSDLAEALHELLFGDGFHHDDEDPMGHSENVLFDRKGVPLDEGEDQHNEKVLGDSVQTPSATAGSEVPKRTTVAPKPLEAAEAKGPAKALVKEPTKPPVKEINIPLIKFEEF